MIRVHVDLYPFHEYFLFSETAHILSSNADPYTSPIRIRSLWMGWQKPLKNSTDTPTRALNIDKRNLMETEIFSDFLHEYKLD